MTEFAIRCDNLVKCYPGGVVAVRGLDLEVRRGECFGLLGPNGAGKTTAIEILEGLLAPTSGNVEVLSMRWKDDERRLRERLGISLQETRLSEKLTVKETLRLFRSFYPAGIDPEEGMAIVSLEEKAGTRVGKLSGGQRQRLAVACALMGDPELLFLDEPTTGLDPQSRRQIWEVLKRFRGRDRTILLTTHYMDEAERLCDRVAIMDQGRVIAVDTPEDLIASLGAEHVIEFALVTAAGQVPEESPGQDTVRNAEGVAGRDPGGVVEGDTGNLAEEDVGDEDANRRGGPGTAGSSDGSLPWLVELDGVTAVRRDAQGIALTVSRPHVTLPALLEQLRLRNENLTRLSIRHASLEDVFVKLTGRRLAHEEVPTP